jgi:hypothetical protein
MEYHIYKITKLGKQINEQYTEKYNPIFESILKIYLEIKITTSSPFNPTYIGSSIFPEVPHKDPPPPPVFFIPMYTRPAS